MYETGFYPAVVLKSIQLCVTYVLHNNVIPMKTIWLLSFCAILFSWNSPAGYAQVSTVTITFDNCNTGMERSGAPADPVTSVPDFAAYSWTCNSVPCIGRTLMTVDLSLIPAGALVVDARLSLYADRTSNLGYYRRPTFGDNNRGYIRRITSPWEAETVTWLNKPLTSKQHQLLLKSSSMDAQDYLDQDVTALVQDMMNYPSYGIILQMADESEYYKSLIFGSGLNTSDTLRPQLVISYIADGQPPQKYSAAVDAWEAEAFPNPASDKLMFEFPFVNQQEMVEITVYSLTGHRLLTENTSAATGYTMDISSLIAGWYFFKAENKLSHYSYTGKFLKQ